MNSSFKILVIHGPNLNLLGQRETEFYGTVTLEEINQNLLELAKDLKCHIECMQSNSESAIMEAIHKAPSLKVQGIIINPAAYGHTSIAIADALSAVKLPYIEVHISNIYKRESFRHHTYLSIGAAGIITGLGHTGYLLALRGIVNLLNNQ